MSYPPKWVSPVVALTTLFLPVMSRIDTSNVPPPKSKINTFLVLLFSLLISLVKQRAAAVGSLMIALQSRPAILAALIVDCFWLSLKYAGTVMTHFSTFVFALISADCRTLSRIFDCTCSGYKIFCFWPFPINITGLSFSSASRVKAQLFRSN